MNLKRYGQNPILKPIKNNKWESKGVFNCGVLYIKNKVYIVYRAVGKDGISRIGLAVSNDGYHIDKRLSKPIFKPETKYELPKQKIFKENKKFRGGCADPRLTQINNKIFLSYAADSDVSHGALASISTKDFIAYNWKAWKRHGILFPDIDDRGATIFPEKIKKNRKSFYAIYHRTPPNIFVAYSDKIKCPWPTDKDELILTPRPKMWDDAREGKIGTGTPPIKTKYGWLNIYHAHRVDKTSGKRVYTLGIFFSDLNNPEKILYRSPKPILIPKKNYEKYGLVKNVVFTCGAIIIKNKLFVYYGGADSVINVATIPIKEVLSLIKKS